jgi:hydroxymethylpyrimidine/phosphomethylpyrimidine kinase
MRSHMLGHLVPEVRSNLGYALPYARNHEDVIAVPGRITEIGGVLVTSARPEFGASRHISKIIITAMKMDPSIRSAMNIRFSPEVISASREMGLKIASFDRREEPESIKEIEGSSLEWGTKRAIEKLGQIPDIIYDHGDIGKEPMVRVLGKDPEEVVKKVIEIGKKMGKIKKPKRI